MLYLAHPIDHHEGHELLVADWVASVRAELTLAGFTIFDPQLAYSISRHPSQPGPGRDIAQVNQAAQEACWAVVAVLPPGVPSWGTPIEVERALYRGQPVAVICGTEAAKSVQAQEWAAAGAYVGSSVLLVEWLQMQKSQPQPIGDPMPVVLAKGGVLPVRHHAGDAGFDLYVSEYVNIEPHEFYDVPCSIRVALPAGMWGWIVGRSSTIRQRGLLVNQGIIDNGWRGELFCGCWNLTDELAQLAPGERIAQIIPMPLLAANVYPTSVQWLDEGDRGEEGFGSTGT